ncbi:MAG: hypothetical protein A3H96_22020 [Acidobacteria bacterium RIFCSPLOWO2_02_FULL_67_36]|nr:MAG: hypothetical protein A3H96_22020 [Acidobacteria bacterium RIFCSPLOWO2_02_FULL_67_36]OFW19871.1 MAG: hypothetical protein A3G21_09615 [Acidobacteria bacterium RIFCSPLOWO2_12_FULL_66_21]
MSGSISFFPSFPDGGTSIHVLAPATDGDHQVRILWFDPVGDVVPEVTYHAVGNNNPIEVGNTPGATGHPYHGRWGVVVCYESGGLTEAIGAVRIQVF